LLDQADTAATTIADLFAASSPARARDAGEGADGGAPDALEALLAGDSFVFTEGAEIAAAAPGAEPSSGLPGDAAPAVLDGSGAPAEGGAVAAADAGIGDGTASAAGSGGAGSGSAGSGSAGSSSGGASAAAMNLWGGRVALTAADEPGAQTFSLGTDLAASFTGEDQIIIVIDDGWSPYYDQSSIIYDYDFAGRRNDTDASVDTLSSHGSWVAETALDEASGAQIVHLKVFGDQGGGASLFDIEEALRHSIEIASIANVAAVNLSLGFGNATSQTFTSLSDEFAMLDAMGVISVAAAGNEGQTYADGVNVIAADPNVISVAAVDANDRIAGFSQTSDSLVDVAALGVGVQVETVFGWGYSINGTSFAAPEISGIAARLSEASWELLGENLTDDELLDVLDKSGRQVQGTDVDWQVADGDAAVAYFIDNLSDYDDPFIA
ncbi:MAG: S8/S53 family peptidase, partial [Pseudomonadota bacterium]